MNFRPINHTLGVNSQILDAGLVQLKLQLISRLDNNFTIRNPPRSTKRLMSQCFNSQLIAEFKTIAHIKIIKRLGRSSFIPQRNRKNPAAYFIKLHIMSDFESHDSYLLSKKLTFLFPRI